MRRPSVLHGVVVLFVLLAAVWIVRNTEWGAVDVPTPLRGEAAKNPFYAAQKLVEMLGATSERREALGRTPADAVVVLSTWAWDIDGARREELERWVEAGGRLVVDAALISGSEAFEEWSGIAREREEVDPGGEDMFRAPEIVEECARLEQVGGSGTVEYSSSTAFEVCHFDRVSWLETDERVLWGLNDDGFLRAARVAVQEGTVTVLNGIPFVGRELFEGEHGELLVAAADLRGGDQVVFMSEADVASLPQLVLRHGAPVVAVLLLIVVLALWRSAVRFGPSLPAVEPARRSLAEQVLGTGRFAVRVGGGAALVAAARRALNEAAARRIAGYERFAADAQADAAAKLAGVDVRELAAALHSQSSSRPTELRATLALLESARRQLVARSQWSKHGKRIG